MVASYKSRHGTETPSLLSSYRWQIVLQNGEKETQFDPSPALGHRSKQQRWRRAQSQTEGQLSQHSTEQKPPEATRPAAKRSVFQRAFSTPAKMPKTQEGGSKLSLRKYLRSVSHWKNQETALQPERETEEASKREDSAVPTTPSALVTTRDAPLWDVASVSLLDRQLVLLGRDEESLLQSHERAGSSVSETSSVYPVLRGQLRYDEQEV
uniref:Uncharacterized protein n=1 Tax=Sphaerodactylus townsendi TaxID=933632 RepID=A0ACB8EMU0_9SAUR